jgi:hypothetical protein
MTSLTPHNSPLSHHFTDEKTEAWGEVLTHFDLTTASTHQWLQPGRASALSPVPGT